MYAKLVVSAGAALVPFKAMRDIGRLITSATPNTSLLEAFSAAGSSIVDTTPAGWTYVGSNFATDASAIPAVGAGTTPTNLTYYNLCFKAPILDYPDVYKHCALTVTYNTIGAATTTGGFTLSGAQSFSSAGVATNEGIRFGTSASAVIESEGSLEYYFKPAASSIFHVIANERHITIVKEGQGIMGIWESSRTEVDLYYNQAPFIQVWHPTTTGPRLERMTTGASPTTFNLPQNTPRVGTSRMTTLTDVRGQAHIGFNITDPNTSTTYGTFDLSDWAGRGNLTGYATNSASTYSDGIPSGTTDVYRMNRNIRSLIITSNTVFSRTISSTGGVRYAVAPIYYCNDHVGYPTQFISGISPLYYTKSGIGNNGDTVSINGTNYTYFDCGYAYAILALTN